MTIRLAASTTEYVEYDAEEVAGGVLVNPTATTPYMAFVAQGTEPASGDWHAASWETILATTPNTYAIRCLVGPGAGGVALAVGPYDVWVRIAATPEDVRRHVDTLYVGTSPAPLVTPAEVALYTKHTFSPDDELFASMVIDMLTGDLETWLGRPLTVQTFTEIHTMESDQVAIFLKNSPVASVASVVVSPAASPVTLEPVNYLVWPWGIQFEDPTFQLVFTPSYAQFSALEGVQVQVTYTGGKDGRNLRDVRGTIIRAAAREYLARDSDAQNLKTLSVAGGSHYTFADDHLGGFTDAELKKLRRHRRVRVG